MGDALRGWMASLWVQEACHRCATEARIRILTLRGGGPYEPLCDPAGNWLVWDAVQENVAEFDGNILFGLQPGEALRISTLMNDGVRLSAGVGSPCRTAQQA